MVCPLLPFWKTTNRSIKTSWVGQGGAAGWIAEEPFVCYSYTTWDWNIYLYLIHMYHKNVGHM